MSEMEFSYNAEAALDADRNANKLEGGVAYVGTFTKASAVVSGEKGTHGIEWEFTSPNQGTTSGTWWVRKGDGGEIGGPGPAFLNAAMYLFGLTALKSEPGKVTVYDQELKERVEVDGAVYPSLTKKPIGLVFQKVMESSKDGGKTYEKLEMYGLFQPETRLTVSELRDRKNKPEKLDKLLKGAAKVNDKRAKGSPGAGEPGQPSLSGVADGGY